VPRRAALFAALALLSAPLVLAAAATQADPRACGASLSSAGTCADPKTEQQQRDAADDGGASQPLVCVVVRTYWAHGTHGDGGIGAGGDRGGGGGGGLPRLLRSLRAQRHGNWRALLLVLDSRPFPDLHHLVADLGDPRVEVFAEWISAKYAARAAAAAGGGGGGNGVGGIGGGGGGDEGGASRGWAPGYHDALYNATDAAVRACPRETEWLAVTNGDNEYDPDFLAAAVAAGAGGAAAGAGGGGNGGGGGDGGGEGEGEGADIVAADYYSRYVRPTAAPCDRFSSAPSPPPDGDAAGEGAPAATDPGGGNGARKAAQEGQQNGTTTATTATTATTTAAAAAIAASAPPCKSNLLRWCQTDLAATVYYWPRIVEEDVKFWDASFPGDAAGSHDGRLAEGLASVGLAGLRRRKLAAEVEAAAAAAAAASARAASASPQTRPPSSPPLPLVPPPEYVPSFPGEERPWRAVRLFPGQRCLVDHHPSPQRCAREGGVWDDSGRATPGATGGRCLDAGEAGILLARDKGIALPGDEGRGGKAPKPPAPNRLEMVEVDVAHDGRSFGIGKAGDEAGEKGAPPTPPPPPPVRLRCLRLRDRAAWPREAAYFGPKCRAEQEGGEGWTYG